MYTCCTCTGLVLLHLQIHIYLHNIVITIILVFLYRKDSMSFSSSIYPTLQSLLCSPSSGTNEPKVAWLNETKDEEEEIERTSLCHYPPQPANLTSPLSFTTGTNCGSNSTVCREKTVMERDVGEKCLLEDEQDEDDVC